MSFDKMRTLNELNLVRVKGYSLAPLPDCVCPTEYICQWLSSLNFNLAIAVRGLPRYGTANSNNLVKKFLGNIMSFISNLFCGHCFWVVATDMTGMMTYREPRGIWTP